jgi:hypothetical protein
MVFLLNIGNLNGPCLVSRYGETPGCKRDMDLRTQAPAALANPALVYTILALYEIGRG